MLSTAALRGMLRADGLRLARDRFLVGITVYILAISVVMRWVLPWLNGELLRRLDFELEPYYPLAVSHIVLQLAPQLGAIVGGFLLLESREDRTVCALLVSPVALGSYLGLVCLVLLLVSFALTAVEAAIIGWGLPPWPALLAAGLAAAPAAPGMALFIAAVARNKVEAFAYLKICGTAPLVASGAYFLPEPWQWLAAVYPPYWASKAYWEAAAGSTAWPWWVTGGLVASALWVAWMIRWFCTAART